jgi:hypothetical protein
MVGYKVTDSDIELIKTLMQKHHDNITRATKEFCETLEIVFTDSSRKRVSSLLHSVGYFPETDEEVKDISVLDKDYLIAKERILPESKYYIITWEQNETPLHTKLWKNILAYKDFLGAELSVILGRYQNPTSVFRDVQHESWNPATRPYWDTNRHDIHKYLTILGDVKIQPTAANPLTGLESISGETTTIIGHPKMHLKPVPVLEGHPKKILLTTGAITLPNYTDSKSGKRGEFHHKLGFTIVEIKDEEIFFIRQVEADENGNFIDLYHEVKGGKVKQVEKAEGIVWGDTHVNSLNPEILDPTEKLIEDLGIKVEVHHDLSDGISVNNHITNNPIEQHKRYMKNEDSIEVELHRTANFLRRRPDTYKIIVQSNHNDRYDRWLINQDWRKDIPNAIPFMKYGLATLQGKADKGILAFFLEEQFTDKEILCLDYDDSYILGGFEIAHHGHIGSNGSKGSIEQFRKMSMKMIIGHYHKPMRLDKVLAVGTSTHLREGYNKGASDWMNSHVIIHSNGTAQHIIFIKGEFTTFKREQ